MKTRITLLVSLLLTSTIITAQTINDNSDYQDLFDLYVFKKYEKCLKKSLRYQDKDKHRRDAEPFLFAAVCFYQMHKTPEKFDPEFEKYPLKEALKNAYKFKKRDKLWLLRDKNQELLNNLRVAGMEQALHYLYKGKNRKAAYYLKWTNKVHPDDYAIKLAQGISQVLNKNIYEGQRNIDLAYKMIYERLEEGEGIEVNSAVKPTTGRFLMEYIKYWDKKNNESKSLQTISMAHLLLGDRTEFWAKLN